MTLLLPIGIFAISILSLILSLEAKRGGLSEGERVELAAWRRVDDGDFGHALTESWSEARRLRAENESHLDPGASHLDPSGGSAGSTEPNWAAPAKWMSRSSAARVQSVLDAVYAMVQAEPGTELDHLAHLSCTYRDAAMEALRAGLPRVEKIKKGKKSK